MNSEMWNRVDVLNTSHDDSNAIAVNIEANSCDLPTAVLFDTGARQGNYVSKRTVEWLRTSRATVDKVPCRVCSIFTDWVLIKTNFNFNIRLNQVFSSHIPLVIKREAENSTPQTLTRVAETE